MAGHPQTFEQDLNITPSCNGEQLALGVDGTSRAYDITTLPLDGFPAQAQGSGQDDPIFIRMQADGSAIYYTFTAKAQGAADAINDTVSVAAGSVTSLTQAQYAATSCEAIPSGFAVEFVLHRSKHKTLVVKCATGFTSVLRMRASSQRSASAQFP